jgi:hypothetical protein
MIIKQRRRSLTGATAVRGDEGLAQAEATITAGDFGVGEYLERGRFEAVAQVLQEETVLEGPAA